MMAKKRGNGEGSIYRRTDGRWVGQYLVHTAKGPKYRYLYGKARAVVAEKLTKAMADRDSGLIFDAGKVTVGDYLGLRWDDADLELGTLRMGRALVREGGRHTLGETKTRRGRRQINLTPRTVNALKAHRKRQLEEKMKLAGLYKDHGLIFASGVGTPVNPENLVKRSFKPLLKEAGLPEIRFHDLRHTCATLLLGRDVHPKLLQEFLGHATIAMTLDTYSHYLPPMGDQTAGAMGDALG
jgi:integrase